MKLYNQHHLPYLGEIKQIPNKGEEDKPIDEYEVVALAARHNITIEDMKSMSFTTLLNILLSDLEDSNSSSDVRDATQADIDRFFGQVIIWI